MSLDAPLNGTVDWTPAGPLGPITTAEKERLAALEEVIDAGLRSFLAVGEALVEVRDSRLYRERYASFEEYAACRHSIGRSRAYQLMDAAEVVSTIVDTDPEAPLPTNEAQARALGAVQPEDRAEVITDVAANGKVTAEAIEQHPKHPKHTNPKPAGVPPTPLGETPAPSPAPIPGPRQSVESEGEPRDAWDAAGGNEPIARPELPCGSCRNPFPAHALYDGWCDACRLDAERGAALRTKPLRAQPEAQESDRLSKPLALLSKAIKDMPPVDDLLTLDAGTLESYDRAFAHLALRAAEWSEARKAANGLRLVKES